MNFITSNSGFVFIDFQEPIDYRVLFELKDYLMMEDD